jgi:hypothetical protein
VRLQTSCIPSKTQSTVGTVLSIYTCIYMHICKYNMHSCCIVIMITDQRVLIPDQLRCSTFTALQCLQSIQERRLHAHTHGKEPKPCLLLVQHSQRCAQTRALQTYFIYSRIQHLYTLIASSLCLLFAALGHRLLGIQHPPAHYIISLAT